MRIIKDMGLDTGSGARYDYEDFTQIMTFLDQEDPMDGTSTIVNNASNYEAMVKKEFGNMLPRTGVYFMPDFKVLDYIR